MNEDFSCEQDSDGIRLHRESLINYLKLEGKRISNFARQGWSCANKIINYYDLVYTCPSDAAGWAFLETEIENYKKRLKEENL